MRYVLAQVRRLLYEHPKVETEGARSRFVFFRLERSHDGIFCYILTRDDKEFLAIAKTFCSGSWTLWTQPAPVLPIVANRLPGPRYRVDKQKAEKPSRGANVAGGRRLPSPTSHRSDISEISNSLPYPQPGSAVIRKQDTP